MSECHWPDWLRNGRMFTTDLHMYDTTRERVDIRAITRTIAACHGNIHRLSALTFMGWAFYDSRHAPKAPGLGGQDCLEEGREESLKHGIKLLAYFNQLGYREDHPRFGQFDLLDERGQPVLIYNVVRATCVNSPWRQLVLDVIGEVFARYEPDGSYLDGGIRRCWCQYCRSAFRRFSGAELPSESALARAGIPTLFSWPEALDAVADPLLRAYAAWQQQVRDDFYQEIRQVVRAAKPDAVTLFHLFPKPSAQDWTVPYDGTLIEGGEKSRPAELWQTQERAQTARHYRVPVFVNLFYNRGAPAEELRHRAYQVLASGCYPNTINVPNADYRGLPGIAEACRLMAQHPDVYDFARTRPVPAVVLPRDPWASIRQGAVSRAHPLGFPSEREVAAAVDEVGNPVVTERRAFPASHVHRFQSATQGMAGALLLSGVPCTTVLPERLEAYLSPTDVTLPQALCLANEATLSDAAVAAVRAFVAAGGGLVATFETSLYDERGRRRDDFALADVFGVHLADGGTIGALGVYDYHLATRSAHPVNRGLPPSARVPYPELVLPIRVSEAEVLATVVKPPASYYPPTGDHIGRLRDSLMAGDDTGFPYAVARTVGKGRVVYFAGRPASAYLHWGLPEQRQWLADAVRWAAGAPLPVTVEALAPVGVSLFAQGERWIVHLVNYGGSLSTPLEHAPPPLFDVTLRVRPPRGAAVLGVRTLGGTTSPVVRYDGDGTTVVLPRLDVYEAVIVELRQPADAA